MSKSLSGFGLHFSFLLMKPKLDIWEPGEHNGTFRGNNLAFVSAKTTIDTFWTTQELEAGITLKSEIDVRGKGLVYGVDCILPELAESIRNKCFENGLIIETCGSDDQVVKFLPALTITENELSQGLNLFEESVKQVMEKSNFHKKLEQEIIQK